MKKCGKCKNTNDSNSNYCQYCGAKLSIGIKRFFKSFNANGLAGAGNKGVSIAPLGAMAVENSKTANHKAKSPVKIIYLDNKNWYCPDCGELNKNGALICSGCGRNT